MEKIQKNIQSDTPTTKEELARKSQVEKQKARRAKKNQRRQLRKRWALHISYQKWSKESHQDDKPKNFKRTQETPKTEITEKTLKIQHDRYMPMQQTTTAGNGEGLVKTSAAAQGSPLLQFWLDGLTRPGQQSEVANRRYAFFQDKTDDALDQLVPPIGDTTLLEQTAPVDDPYSDSASNYSSDSSSAASEAAIETLIPKPVY